MKRIGKQLVEQKRAAVLAQNTGTETIDGNDVSQKDLLSILGMPDELFEAHLKN